jgi:hypothetical protein
MFLAPWKPPASRTAPLATSMSAMRGLPIASTSSLVVKRSVAKAIRVPSGENAGSISAKGSLVSRRSALPARS